MRQIYNREIGKTGHTEPSENKSHLNDSVTTVILFKQYDSNKTSLYIVIFNA